MSAQANPVLRLFDVRKSFGNTEIMRGVRLDIVEGERHAVIGPNGAGKSTLFNLISGRFPPSAGRIEFKGEDLRGLQPYQVYRRGISRSFQVTHVFSRMTVYENLRCAVLCSKGWCYAPWRFVDRLAEVQRRTEQVLELIGLRARRDTAAGVMTYAEQRALEIGLTIAGGATTILLDEPTAGMSRAETERVVELIRRVTAGCTLVMIEHDMSVVFELADRISVLVHGEIIACDRPAAIKADARVQEAYLGKAA